MRYLFIFLLGIGVVTTVFGQQKIDLVLQKKIRSMFRDDQKWRVEYNNINSGKISAFSEKTIDDSMRMVDSRNMVLAKAIIRKYGFPGYLLVDTTGCDGFWAIIQHCDEDVPFQQQVLVLMAKEVKRNNAPGDNYALLQDRVLVNTGHKQLYGTQVRVDPKTHKASPLPIEDEQHVDTRRKAVGLQPLKDYLKIFEKH